MRLGEAVTFRSVCEVMQKYIDIEVKRERIETIKLMLKENCADSFILKFYTIEELNEAKEEIFELS